MLFTICDEVTQCSGTGLSIASKRHALPPIWSCLDLTAVLLTSCCSALLHDMQLLHIEEAGLTSMRVLFPQQLSCLNASMSNMTFSWTEGFLVPCLLKLS